MERTLYDIVIYFFEMLIAFAFFNKSYENKLKSNKLIMLIGAFLFIACSFVFSYLYNIALNLLLFFIINYAFARICYKITIKSAILYCILLDAIMFASEIFTIFLTSWIFKISVNEFRNDLLVYIILSSISKLLYFAVSQAFSFFIKRKSPMNFEVKKIVPLFVFPILTMASLAIFLFVALETEITAKYQVAISVVSTLSIISCAFIFIYYQLMLEDEAKIMELESEKRLYNLNTTYLNVLEHQNNELQMLFHDTKHHYSALSSFDDIKDVKSYIAKIYSSLEEKNTIKITKNKMLNLILNKYIVVCKNNNIKFDYEAKTTTLDYIDNSELSIILNNILDNAVEAAKMSSEKCIEFSLRCINNMDLLSVVNSCDYPPKHSKDQLLTTKFDKSNHGFGTKIIRKHAKKNNGKYAWFYDADEHRFHSTILFQRKNNESGSV